MYDDIPGYEGKFFVFVIKDEKDMLVGFAFSKLETVMMPSNTEVFEFENTPDVQDFFYDNVLKTLDVMKDVPRPQSFFENEFYSGCKYPVELYPVLNDLLCNYDETLEV